MKKILFVDDEEYVLTGLTRAFAETPYETVTAANGRKAIEVLEKEKFDMIITDMRMPGIDGHQLLSIVRERYPEMIRLILSGLSDIDDVFSISFDGSAKIVLFKPWDNEELVRTIDKIFATEDILSGRHLFSFINNMGNLPTIKKSRDRLVKLIRTNASIAELAAEVEKDPAIVASILKVVNSAFYGARCSTTKQAIIFLGMINISNIILSTQIMSQTVKIDHPLFDRDILWQHCGICNSLTAMFYEKFLNKKLPNEIGAAGLLHDIGRIVMLSVDPAACQKMSVPLEENQIDILTEEYEVFGFSHQDIGGFLLNWWQVPYGAVESALYHHIPNSSQVINRELVCVVHLADYYAWTVMDHFSETGLCEDCFKVLNTSREACEEFVEEYRLKHCQQDEVAAKGNEKK
jgi:HD-like signal output (HDOD) protein/ActR/RegA family two-component response regulator